MEKAHGFYDFRKDLAVATDTESEVASLLEKIYNVKIIERRHDNQYDLKARNAYGSFFTFEVKEDFTHARTGNVGVEFSCRGKDSGIRVSKADYYIYKLHFNDGKTETYIMRTETLKKMVEDKLYFRIVNGGDKGSDSMNYLFKSDVFRAHGKKISD
jgi:hypothetical protein